ncbi:hypothetical protein [Pseudosulfitobacter koreensis]|uniref:Uncharacterized protein n=1 Tax=Pseudosulfitobacter koreensis TaxID=2968472 RepID=A0ABT1Z1E3_9RHOB|nr:hypothetical protein [Pseudosulfitobacter koreense]MCR8826961.1 hypothetical protein [Pseudosulfitobacter koreense]
MTDYLTFAFLRTGAVILVIGGCDMSAPVDLVDADTRNRIAVCSAGIGLELSADLQAELSEFALSGSLSAAARSEIRGTMFGGADLSDAATAQAFESYIGCIRQETRLFEYIAVLENRRAVLLRELESLGVDDARLDSLARSTSQHIEATRTGNLVLANDLYREITMALIELRRETTFAGELLYIPS